METETSNERLCNIFEMVVSRLDSLGNQMDTMQQQLGMLAHGIRHADSIRPLGSPFSGVAHLGMPVELTVFASFDAEGIFHRKNELVVVTEPLPGDGYDLMWCGPEPWKWDADMEAAWGKEKYDSIRARMVEWFVVEKVTSTGEWIDPTCADMGLPSTHGSTCVFAEIHWTAIKQRNQGLLEGGSGGMIMDCSNLKQVVNIMRGVAQDMDGVDTYTPNTVEIYQVPKHLQALATAFVTHTGWHEAWAALSASRQTALLNGEYRFFTIERILQGGVMNV